MRPKLIFPADILSSNKTRGKQFRLQNVIMPLLKITVMMFMQQDVCKASGVTHISTTRYTLHGFR